MAALSALLGRPASGARARAVEVTAENATGGTPGPAAPAGAPDGAANAMWAPPSPWPARATPPPPASTAEAEALAARLRALSFTPPARGGGRDADDAAAA